VDPGLADALAPRARESPTFLGRKPTPDTEVLVQSCAKALLAYRALGADRLGSYDFCTPPGRVRVSEEIAAWRVPACGSLRPRVRPPGSLRAEREVVLYVCQSGATPAHFHRDAGLRPPVLTAELAVINSGPATAGLPAD
jgi:hypothetical protein